MKRWGTVYLIFSFLFCCLFFPATALADGTDITKQCDITLSNGESAASLSDGIGYKGWTAHSEDDSLTINPPEGTSLTGLWLSYLTPPGAFTLQTEDGTVVFSQTNDECYIQFIRIPEQAQNGPLTLRNEGNLCLGEIRAFSGEPGDEVRLFDPPAEKCDILIIVAHPDDDVLYFAGTVPVYTVNRNYKVQVVFLTSPSRRRVEEGMYCQWMLGNRLTPVFGAFPDKYTESLADGEAVWDMDALDAFIVEQIRRFKPSVVLTHDLDGEYGHGAHMVTAVHTLACVQSAGDETFYPDSVAQYGIWNVAKCYLHLYQENQVEMDWDETIPSMGGKSALQIARTAYKEHVTQAQFNMDVRTSGRTNSLLFGLAYTLVGEDNLKNDFLENITPDALSALNPAYYATPTPALTPTPGIGNGATATAPADSLPPLLLPVAAVLLVLVFILIVFSKRRASR